MQTLNLEQLKAATLCGGVTDVTLLGDGAAFVVSIQTRSGEAVMVTTRKQPRWRRWPARTAALPSKPPMKPHRPMPITTAGSAPKPRLRSMD